MTTTGNNCTRFNSSETFHSTSPLPCIENLSNSLHDLSFCDLGFVENSQTGDERNRSLIGVPPTFFLGNQTSSGPGIESACNPVSARGRGPQSEGWDVQQTDIEGAYSVQGSMNDNSDMGSISPPSSIVLNTDQAVGPATGYRISQLELMGAPERPFWPTGSVLNYHQGLANSWTNGRDETSNESFMHNFRPDTQLSYNAYNGSNSIRGMQSPDHLTGGLYFHRAQTTRTHVANEYYSNSENNAPYFGVTRKPLPEVVLQNSYRLQMADLSLLEELSGGDIQVLSMDPMGCNYLLRILAQREPFAINKILNGALDVIFEVMSNQIGNLLFQRLLKCCNENQIERIIARITGSEDSLINVANTKSGTHSIQKLVKSVKKFALMLGRLTLALIPRLHDLMNNPHGCHVVICLSQIQGCHYPLLYEAIVERCLTLATEERGCVTLNKCIDNSKSPFREILLTLISNDSVFLSQDPYGNFVVQHVLELEVPNITRNVCLKLKGNCVKLSTQKGGSHVVEKCLWSSQSDCIIRELINSEKLDQLARDQYGNYVIQTALKRSKGSLCNMLVKELMKHARSLRCHPYGKNVINLLCSSWISSSEGPDQDPYQ